MCTVTYLPLQQASYILTSNRDEKISRPAAQLPQKVQAHDQILLYPTDALHQGTWFACSEKGRAVCLLNGAFTQHISQPPYKKSRGLVVLDAFAYADANDFILCYDFNGIEPFTMIYIGPHEFYEIRWDGQKITLRKLSKDLPYVWSSVTLYTEEVIQKRKSWFETWIKQNPAYRLEDILNFHLFAGEGDKENDVKMNRNNGMQTVSITSLYHCQEYHEMAYRDLVSNLHHSEKIKLNTSVKAS